MATILEDNAEYQLISYANPPSPQTAQIVPKPGSQMEKLQLRGARLAAASATLDGWAADAVTVVAAWDTMTQTQKNAALKVVVTRFGTLSSHLADLLRHLGV